MRFKHKEFILGIILGNIICGSFTTIANESLNVSLNPFKILVNGVNKHIEGYNINGSTYFKLRDIGNQVGFKVDFKEDTIMIDTDNDISTTTISSEESLYNFVVIDDVEYISSKDVDSVVFNYLPEWVFAYTDNIDSWTKDGKSWCYLSKLDNNANVLEEYEIPCKFINDVSYITRKVFEDEILKRITE